MATNNIQPALANETNNDYIARAMKYKQPKDMFVGEQDCHQAIRNFFRICVEETGAASINKATVEQLITAIEKAATYIKAGTVYEPHKLAVADQVVVACWSLRFECNVVAKSGDITVGRAIEKHILADFDFKANESRKKAAPEKATPAKKQPAEPAPAAIIGDWVERLDLLPQLEFHGAEPVSKVAELLEAWNAGGEFRLMAKRTTEMGNTVKSLDETHDRQTLLLYDVSGKKIGMAYMDKLLQYFTIMEKTA